LTMQRALVRQSPSSVPRISTGPVLLTSPRIKVPGPISVATA